MRVADSGGDMCRLTVQGKKEAEAGHKIREELFKRGYVSQHKSTTQIDTHETRGEKGRLVDVDFQARWRFIRFCLLVLDRDVGFAVV